MTYRYGNQTFADLPTLLDALHIPAPQAEIAMLDLYTPYCNACKRRHGGEAAAEHLANLHGQPRPYAYAFERH